MPQPLDELVEAQKRGERRGLPAVCSAHPWVLAAAMQQAASRGAPLLIEATCNQVNQFGGYTGMTPGDFVRYVGELANRNRFPKENLTLGGDHLGPSPWQSETAAEAAQKSADLVRAYVRAGFTKIHLDASMPLADDPPGPLALEASARRTAELAKVAEESAAQVSGRAAGLRYVIGAEVPVPGGAHGHKEKVEVTSVPRLRRTIDLTREAFCDLGLEAAWVRVVAVVVQPGVEFGDDFVHAFRPQAARHLSAFIEAQPGLVFEAHSSDYQSLEALRALVAGHFAILKVGPALTFAFRETVFALAHIEDELFPPGERSGRVETLEAAMLQRPQHWEKYYRGDEATRRQKRQSSLSDRIRYYWSEPQVQKALEHLLDNLGKKPLPLPLVGRYASVQHARIQQGEIAATPEALIQDGIREVLRRYDDACGR